MPDAVELRATIRPPHRHSNSRVLPATRAAARRYYDLLPPVLGPWVIKRPLRWSRR
jgi:hypothetical protein